MIGLCIGVAIAGIMGLASAYLAEILELGTRFNYYMWLEKSS
jgi:hypothetical protein